MKAQMKMMESILVLVVFFFLLVFGLIYYANFSQTSAKLRSSERIQESLDQVYKRLEFLPELQCGSQISTCIDYFKAVSFSDVVDDNPVYYGKLFSNTKITAVLVFPDFQNITIFDKVYDTADMSKKTFYSPITLYDETKKGNEAQFGYLAIEVFY